MYEHAVFGSALESFVCVNGVLSNSRGTEAYAAGTDGLFKYI